MNELCLSDDLLLPAEAITQKFAFLGSSGSGKSYGASKLCEEMLNLGAQVIALDPVGVWYGLRLAADGSGKGFAIPVFGGEHGDLLLQPQMGAIIANLVVDRNISLILDVSNFRKNERKQFVTDFAEQLFHRKKTNRSALHIFLEEAQTFAPQKVFKGDERMLGAFEDVAKLGRNYGIGFSAISQRPQSINKDVLNQIQCLLAFRMTAPQERKAIQEWVKEQGGEDITDTLPSLATGQPHVWSPEWLKVSKTVRIAQKRTYDASATPVFGSTPPVNTHALIPVDMEEIRAVLTEAIAQMEENDPRALRRRIAELEKQLKAKQSKSSDGEVTVQQLEKIARSLQISVQQLAQVAKSLNVKALPPKAPVPEKKKDEGGRRKEEDERVGISNPQQQILNALAAFESLGLRSVARNNVAVFSGQSPKSSGYTNNLGALRGKGLIEYPAGGQVALTTSGRSIAVSLQIKSLSELHAAWYARLSNPQARILKALVQIYPQLIDRSSLAVKVSQSPSSSGYTNNLGALRSLGVIDYPKPGYVVATPLLFPVAEGMLP